MYSINRETETSLRETLLPGQSQNNDDNISLVQSSLRLVNSTKLQASLQTLSSASQKVIKNLGEEMSMYLESFLMPYGFFMKFNKEETQLYFIKENEEQKKMILCIYDLTKQKPQCVQYRVPESSEKFDKIDLSEDGKYILFSSKAEIVIQRTDSLYDFDNELSPNNHASFNLDNEDQNDVYAFFSNINQVIYFQFCDDELIAKQTQFSVNELFEGEGMIKAQINPFTISAQIKTQEQKIDEVSSFNQCLYIMCPRELHVYLPEISTNDIKQKANFWDPLKGNQKDENSFFQNVRFVIPSNDILIIFFYDLQVKFFKKSPAHKNSISENSCIELINEFDIKKFDDGQNETYPFKLYKDNLYIDNSTLRNIQVVSLKNLNVIWSYSYQFNYDITPKMQLKMSPQINFFDMELKAVTSVDEFNNELLFTNMFPHQTFENKFLVAENEYDLLFRNLDNQGLISILDKNQKEHIRKVGDSFDNIDLYFRNKVQSIFYSEELKIFFLLQSICRSVDQYQYSLFTLSTEAFNYEVKQISIAKLLNQFRGIDLSQIVGTIHCSETNKNSLILFVRIHAKGLLMYRLNFQDAKQEISVIKNFDGCDHQILINGYFHALIIKDLKMIISDDWEDNFSLFYNFDDQNFSQTIQFNQTTKNLHIHSLLKVVNNVVHMIEGATRNIVIYEIEPNKKELIKLRSMNPIIKPQTFTILNEQLIDYFKDGYVIYSNNFLIRQSNSTIYIFDIENFEVRCKINNVPELSKFMRTSDGNFYLFADSSIDPTFKEVKRFNFLKDKKLLKLNEKQQLQEQLLQRQNKLTNEQIQSLENNFEVFQSNIPLEFQVSQDTCVVYDYLDSSVELLDSRDTISKKISSKLQNRSIVEKSLLKSSNQALFIEFLMKNEKNFNECLYFDTMNNQSILSLVLDKPLIMKYIIERFLMMNEQDLPFLMFKDHQGKTPFDYAIEGQQYQNIEQLIKLIVYHKSAAQMYNSLIDKNLIKLIEMELDLKELLESEILYQPIHSFDPLDSTKNSYLYPTLFDTQEEIIKNKELIINNANRLLISEDQDKVQENKQLEKRFSVNFTLINMKNTITCQQSEEQNSLMQSLMDQTRDDIFEFSCIQNIIDYKWNTYAKKEYLSQFRWFFALVIMFYLSLGIELTIIDEKTSGQENFIVAGLDLLVLSNAILTVCSSLITLKFLVFEVKQLLSYEKKLEYFQELWNINDLVFLVLIPVYCFFSLIQFQDLSSTIMKSVKILIVAALFVKMIFYLRIFETFSFLVSMLENVLIQLKSFLIFFMIVVIAFSCFIQVLLPESSASYEGTGYFSYIMLSLRTAIGDFTFDSYKAQDMKGITWVVWLFLMIMGNIVFMNFIIAVIGDSYQSSMAKKVSQIYRLKVPFILEIEKQLKNKEGIDYVQEQWKNSIKNQKLLKKGSGEANESSNSQLTICFPNYIVVQTLSTGEAAAKDSLLIQIEIQSSINNIKKTQALLQKQIEINQINIEQKIEKGQEEMAKQIEEIRQFQNDVQDQLESLNLKFRKESEATTVFLLRIEDALKEGFRKP